MEALYTQWMFVTLCNVLGISRDTVCSWGRGFLSEGSKRADNLKQAKMAFSTNFGHFWPAELSIIWRYLKRRDAISINLDMDLPETWDPSRHLPEILSAAISACYLSHKNWSVSNPKCPTSSIQTQDFRSAQNFTRLSEFWVSLVHSEGRFTFYCHILVWTFPCVFWVSSKTSIL